ncbi:MAG: hypothetical protein LBC02_10460 [Planctomycetaceae bacterium]|nr:hypothetical protein [Planctomycetaceae bacterium]
MFRHIIFVNHFADTNTNFSICEWFTFLGSFKYLLRPFVQYLFCCPDKPEWKSDNRAKLKGSCSQCPYTKNVRDIRD